MNPTTSDRRDFLAATGRILGGGWMALHLPLLAALAACGREASVRGEPLRVLSSRDANTLAALGDMILPPDDLPGAADAGVVHFIDQILEGQFAEMRTPLEEGLADLERRARRVDATADFGSLLPDERAAIVRDIEETEFFELTRFLTVLGVFADPSYGGNRGGAGLRILGVEPHGAYQPPFGYYDEEYARAWGAA
jgi:hypothetical protein